MRPESMFRYLGSSWLGFLALCCLVLLLERVLQTVLPPQFPRPHLMLSLAIVSALRGFSYRGAFCCMFLGLLEDLSVGIVLGGWGVAYVLAYALVAGALRRWIGASLLGVALVASLIGIPLHFLQAGIEVGLLAAPKLMSQVSISGLLLEALATGLGAIPVVFLWRLQARSRYSIGFGGLPRYAA